MKMIEENAAGDYSWGCGKDGSGQNKLGHILMRVRAELRAVPTPTANKALERTRGYVAVFRAI